MVAASDFDGDGDLDLFIGGRSVPGVYGINPTHQLLENDGNAKFQDITESRAYDLKELGMVTAATWADMDKDGKDDLILVGDWMAPKIFRNTGKDLLPLKTNLGNLTGAWSSLKAEDLNNDGNNDLILGNRGQNSFYQATEKAPVKVYVNDFDNNGTIEQIFTRPINGKDVPVHLRRELSGQIAAVKKQNMKFSEYATKSIDELFSKEVLDNSIQRNISSFKSLIAYSNGDGSFTLEELPAEVQFSSVHAIGTLKTEGSEFPAILLAGNDLDLKPQYGRLDGNSGIWLARGEDGKYKVADQRSTGFELKGQVRALESFRNSKGESFIIAGINNQAPKIFKISNEKP